MVELVSETVTIPAPVPANDTRPYWVADGIESVTAGPPTVAEAVTSGPANWETV
jgi:hypothetical protein